MGERTKYVVGKLGIFDKNEKTCVGRKIVFIPPALVGIVSSGRLGENETISIGATSFAKTGKIQGLYRVGQPKEQIISI